MNPTVTRFRLARLLPIFAVAALSTPSVDARPLTSGSFGSIEPDLAPLSTAGALDTMWFGGTVWNPDSSRWEAIPGGAWTFQSGVGSSIVPPGDPDKAAGLHRTMEGWTAETTQHEFFRRLTVDDFDGETDVCVGAPAGLGGNASLWAGVRLADLGDGFCYAGGAGYGNNWDITVGRTFAYSGSGTVTLGFDYRIDTEPGYDSAYVEVDTDAGGPAAPVVVAAYNGSASGSASILLTQGNGTLPAGPGDIQVRFRVVSDGSYSDEDGLDPSECGAFAVDDIVLSGAINDLSDFETGSDGWAVIPGNVNLEWSDLRALDDLPETVAPSCGVHDSVLVFYNHDTGIIDVTGSRLVASPWIDLKAAGVEGSNDVLIELDVFQNFVRPERVGYAYYLQKYPVPCPSTGMPAASDFYNVTLCYFGPDPCRFVDDCSTDDSPRRHDLPPIEASIERIRVAVAATNNCSGWGDCPGPNNDTTPYIDNIRVGVAVPAGVSDAGQGVRPAAGLRVLGPNPIVRADRTRFELGGRAGAAVRLEIVNIAGAVVRTVYEGKMPGMPVTVEWDMRTAAGTRVPGGIYFARLDGDVAAVRKIVVVH